jgi:hypothetical protein
MAKPVTHPQLPNPTPTCVVYHKVNACPVKCLISCLGHFLQLFCAVHHVKRQHHDISGLWATGLGPLHSTTQHKPPRKYTAQGQSQRNRAGQTSPTGAVHLPLPHTQDKIHTCKQCCPQARCDGCCWLAHATTAKQLLLLLPPLNVCHTRAASLPPQHQPAAWPRSWQK